MPTVLRIGGLRVIVYPSDHRPAHVHVIGAGSESVFNLNCPKGPVELRENFGFSRRDVRRIREDLNQAIQKLCASWRTVHGQI